MGDASSQPRQPQPAKALVVVLGDLGRSPRMVQHALALAAGGTAVVLAGYLETPLDERVRGRADITVEPLSAAPAAARDAGFLSFALRTFWRLLQLHWSLGRLLWRRTQPGVVVLVQNPPSLPTLWLAGAVARMRRARLVVDWHNFGFSMLALRFGASSLLVKLARLYELWAGRRADGAFCVSQAMQTQLAGYGVLPPPEVVYDRPVALDPPLEPSERRALLACLLPDTPQTDVFLVCPTSWTADEDVSLLIDALKIREGAEAESLPSLFILLTGKGPLRASFEVRLSGLDLTRAAIRTHFFDPIDYRQILRAADLGLSLHRSSSGVDLPMKIIDFYGARTPVLALDYAPCLGEQVRDGVDGRTFCDAEGLARLLAEGPATVAALRQGIDSSSPLWADEVAAGWRALESRWSRPRG